LRSFRLPGPRSASWVLAENLGSAVFSLFSMLLIGRAIGPEATGVGTVAIAAFLLLDVLTGSLFSDALVQHPALAARHARSATTAAVLAGLGTGLALALIGPLLAAGTGMPQVAWLALALGPLLPLSAFSGAASGLLLRELRFRLLALRVLVGLPLALVAGLLVAREGHGPWAMVAAQVVATGTTFLLVLAFGRLQLRPALDLGALRELWPVAGPQIAAVVVMVGKYRIFLLALGLVVAEATVALSHFAFRMLDAVLATVWQSVSRLSLPRLCRLQHDRPALAEAYGELAELQALMGLPLAVGVALTAPDLVHALLGPEWAETADAARIAGLAAALGFLHGDHSSLFVAVGKARRNFYTSLAALGVPLLALLVVRPVTPAGVALAWAIQSLVLPPVLAWLVLRELRRSPLWLARRVAPAAAATGAMAVAVLLVQQGLMADMPPLPRLLAAAAAGVAVFLPLAFLALGRRWPHALRRGTAGLVPAE
jgi:PST family polysaccharide transporter